MPPENRYPRRYSIILDAATDDAIDTIALEQGRSKASLVRQVLMDFVKVRKGDSAALESVLR